MKLLLLIIASLFATVHAKPTVTCLEDPNSREKWVKTLDEASVTLDHAKAAKRFRNKVCTNEPDSPTCLMAKDAEKATDEEWDKAVARVGKARRFHDSQSAIIDDTKTLKREKEKLAKTNKMFDIKITQYNNLSTLIDEGKIVVAHLKSERDAANFHEKPEIRAKIKQKKEVLSSLQERLAEVEKESLDLNMDRVEAREGIRKLVKTINAYCE